MRFQLLYFTKMHCIWLLEVTFKIFLNWRKLVKLAYVYKTWNDLQVKYLFYNCLDLWSANGFDFACSRNLLNIHITYLVGQVVS